MSEIHSRPVNPMSLLTDVFVAAERLRVSLMGLRDGMTLKPDARHAELHDAMRHCRKIIDELRCIRSLQRGPEFECVLTEMFGPPEPDPNKPKGPPDLKLVS